MNIAEIAQRIYDIDPYEMRNNDATTEDIIRQINDDPDEVISYLLDIIDDLQA